MPRKYKINRESSNKRKKLEVIQIQLQLQIIIMDILMSNQIVQKTVIIQNPIQYPIQHLKQNLNRY